MKAATASSPIRKRRTAHAKADEAGRPNCPIQCSLHGLSNCRYLVLLQRCRPQPAHSRIIGTSRHDLGVCPPPCRSSSHREEAQDLVQLFVREQVNAHWSQPSTSAGAGTCAPRLMYAYCFDPNDQHPRPQWCQQGPVSSLARAQDPNWPAAQDPASERPASAERCGFRYDGVKRFARSA